MRLLADHCDLYNAALMERREAWRMRAARISYGMQSAQLKSIRQADPDGQGRHSFTAQQQTLRRLDTVFGAFFDRVKAARRSGAKTKAGCPRFKPYQRFSQVRFVNGDGAKWVPAGRTGWARAQFQAVGSVKVRQHREVTGTVKAPPVEMRASPLVRHRDRRIRPGTASRDRTYGRRGSRRGPVPHHVRRRGHRQPALSHRVGGRDGDLQRRKARAGPGSGTRKRLRRALAREWRKVRNRRCDFHHKTARALVDSCDMIALEQLNTAGMTRHPTRTRPVQAGWVPAKPGRSEGRTEQEHPRRGVVPVRSILVGKAESAGRRVVLVNAAGTSITCHQCGLRCVRPARYRHLPGTQADGRRRQRGQERLRQGRAGLWSGC